MAGLKHEQEDFLRVKEEPTSLQIKDKPELCHFKIITVKTEDENEEDKKLVFQQNQSRTEEEGENREENSREIPNTEDSDTDLSDNYSPEQVKSRRSFAMFPPDSAPFSCSDCGTTFRCNSEFKIHRLRHADTRPFVCSVCEKGFVRKPDLSRHQTRAHHFCPVCSQQLNDKSALNQHLKGHVVDGSLDQDSPLIKEPEKPFSCSECGLTFRWHSHLQSHAASVHRGERPHSCSFCGKNFSFRSQLLSHTRLHTGEKPHCCSVCGKSFAVKSVLKQHLKIHTDDRPFSCSVCDKGFINKKDQAWHQTFVHHLCPVCCSAFTQQSALGEHLKGHVEDGSLDSGSALLRGIVRPFGCPECGKGFQKNSDLKRHKFSHSGDKPFSCSVCEATFNQKSSLKQHLKIHTGEKPFGCSVCQKGFLVKKDLTWHQAFVHFLCPLCSLSFTEKSGLGEHLREHIDEGTLDLHSALFRGIARPFSCADCGKSFTKNSDLKRHACGRRGGIGVERPHSSSSS